MKGNPSCHIPLKLLVPRSCVCRMQIAISLFIVIGYWLLSLGPKGPLGLTDGDRFDCIPIQKLLPQLPAPGTRLRLAPSMEPHGKTSSDFSTFRSLKQARQLIVHEKQICPKWTVPLRARSDVIYLNTIWGRRAYTRVNSDVHLHIAEPVQEAIQSNSSLWANDHDSHEYAIVDFDGPYSGTQGRLSVCHPRVQEQEFSLAQVWVLSFDVNDKLHSLEAGWQIYPQLYSDSVPRLFVYWTTDDYNTTGCYNLNCPGFVQVSNKWLLGGSFAEVSTLDPSKFEYEIKIQIFKDRRTGDWWLQLNDENVGYWPKSLFGLGAFSDSNIRINWGGEIWHRRGQYTDTQMGNGNHPASSSHRRVAYMRNLRVVNHQDKLRDLPRALTVRSTYRKCCHLVVHRSDQNNRSDRSTWGTYAYFGGPGFHADCVEEKLL